MNYYRKLYEENCYLRSEQSKLVKQITQLTNNWNELEEWLIDYRTNMDNPDIYEEGIIDCLDEVLGKMKEIKEENNENK